MKWKCTYFPEEQEEADADLAVLIQRHPSAKVRKSDRHLPLKHLYLTTKKSETPCNSKEKS